ncbi:uncharacterized protein LOC113778050 isoform X1 [Coffea eugenioides]|uniref:uncharacterized protein LOC113778050 isoform X1 n=1 Tax=Coffea eugenioides TaxID=49369 RepID=UPI000F611BCB|nr:uncharacterized protein LOC113778050 isoform X1 [Coffea eugenioides]
MEGAAESSNGVHAEVSGDGEDKKDFFTKRTSRQEEETTLYTVFNRLIAAMFFPSSASAPLLRRSKAALAENVPLLRLATKNTARHVLLWTRRGSPLRALLVVSVGTIALMALTGLLVFMFFYLAANVNAIVISSLMSLAAAGGLLAIFFAFVTAIYIGALSVAVFVISATTISAIIAPLITAGCSVIMQFPDWLEGLVRASWQELTCHS